MSTLARDPDPDRSTDAARAAPPKLAVHPGSSRLERVERLLEEIRSSVDASARARQHKDFSAALLAGAIAQIFAIGMLALAVFDWIFSANFAALFTKLAFALVLQTGALTAFVLAGPRRN